MQGPSGPSAVESAGMIPRAVQQIYEVAQKLADQNWTYTMDGQFLEIYNETVHDLLGDAASYGKIKHDIRHHKDGRTTVSDMTIGTYLLFFSVLFSEMHDTQKKKKKTERLSAASPFLFFVLPSFFIIVFLTRRNMNASELGLSGQSQDHVAQGKPKSGNGCDEPKRAIIAQP